MSQVHEEFDLKATQPDRDTLRATMPATAETKDLFVSLFGPGVRLVYAEEGGQVVSSKARQPDESFRVALTASQYIRLGEIGDEYLQSMTAAKAGNGK